MDPDQIPGGNVLSEAYEDVETRLERLTPFELAGVVGAVVAEFVNRGNDTETALQLVLDAARSGADGSRVFDMMAD